MAIDNRAQKRRNRRRNGHGKPGVEDRRSLAVTVAWMMATLATAAALLLFALARAWTASLPSPPERPHPLTSLPGVLLFTAVVTSSLVLILVPVVYRVRSAAPPLAITIVATTIAAGAWVILLVTTLL